MLKSQSVTYNSKRLILFKIVDKYIYYKRNKYNGKYYIERCKYSGYRKII